MIAFRAQCLVFGNAHEPLRCEEFGDAIILGDCHHRAPVKLFITADPQARANRRAKETGHEVSATINDLAKRDLADSTRAASPLEVAPGARVIDTTHMELSEVIAQVVDIARATRG